MISPGCACESDPYYHRRPKIISSSGWKIDEMGFDSSVVSFVIESNSRTK